MYPKRNGFWLLYKSDHDPAHEQLQTEKSRVYGESENTQRKFILSVSPESNS